MLDPQKKKKKWLLPYSLRVSLPLSWYPLIRQTKTVDVALQPHPLWRVEKEYHSNLSLVCMSHRGPPYLPTSLSYRLACPLSKGHDTLSPKTTAEGKNFIPIFLLFTLTLFKNKRRAGLLLNTGIYHNRRTHQSFLRPPLPGLEVSPWLHYFHFQESVQTQKWYPGLGCPKMVLAETFE